MTLEDIFAQKVDEWKHYCKENAHHNFAYKYVNCNAYHALINMGPQILPLIRQELSKEYDLFQEYYRKREKFETAASLDDLQRISSPDGNPSRLWLYVIKSILPEFSLPIVVPENGVPIPATHWDVNTFYMHPFSPKDDPLLPAAIEWLEENMHKYL